jgi:D-alanine-D-alanine ligase
LGCRHYSRQDFRISERAGDRGKVYILEVNTLPGLTTESLMPKAVEAVGSSYPEFLDHILTLALN